MFIRRHGLPEDDLAALWPEVEGHTLNYEQVLVIADEEEPTMVLAAGILFHGGHSFAYVGAIKVVTDREPAWALRALMRYAHDWCKERGIRVLGHGAVTEECEMRLDRLVRPLIIRPQVFYQWNVEELG